MVPFSLPSFAPSNLQHNLLSYLVRRFLGPLLQNGAQSLDHQLATPSQPGIFTLRDVQLDPKALEDSLSGSLLPFTIQAVSLSELSLQINWPSWSFSLQGYVPDIKITLEGIHITIGVSENQSNHLTTTQHEAQSHLLNTINLDENLADIANDFVSQGWAESSCYEDQLEQDFPGAFNTKPNSAITPSPGDQDQRGFFAGLVQKILAKFNFELKDLTVLLSHQQLQVLLSIDHIKSLELSSDDVQTSSSISREIRTSYPVIYLQHLSDQSQDDQIPSPNSSSNQSFDSEHDMLMSQAIVDLRRPASLFVSAADILHPIDEQVSGRTPASKSIIKPENILLQFLATSTAETPVSKPSAESPLPPREQATTSGDSTDLLNLSNSLRVLFWFANSSTSSPTEEASSDPNQPDSPHPSNQETTTHVQRSQLNIQIYLPILDVLIRLPRHLNALTQLVSTLLSTIPSTSTDSRNNPPSTSTSEIPSLAISAVLKLHALNCTLAFPTPYPQSITDFDDDSPLSSLNIRADMINIAFNTSPVYPVAENQASQTRSELRIRVDRINGRSEILHSHPSSKLHSGLLLAPARDDHPSPALSITQTIDGIQIVFGSIWLNLDLQVVAVLIPLVEALQSAFAINPTTSSSSSLFPDEEELGDRSASHSLPSRPPTSIGEGSVNLNSKDKFTTTISIPCLYIDIKSPNQRESTGDQLQPELILGSVLKTFQVIVTSEKQIGCSVFEVALGFRVSNAIEGRTHAALSPFLGIAHPCMPSSKDQQNRFPGLRLTHMIHSPSHSQKPAAHSISPDPPHRPTSIKLETVTIDLSKDQFDKLHYWLDDLGRWANTVLIDPPLESSHTHTKPNTLDAPENRSSGGLSNRQEQNKGEDDQDGLLNLVGTVSVSKISLTIRLPSDRVESQRKITTPSPPTPPLKLIIQLELLSIQQFRLPSHDEFDGQIRLLIRSCSAALHHHHSSSPSLPILYQVHHPKPSTVSSAVSVVIFTATQSQSSISDDNKPHHKKIMINVDVNRSILRIGPCCIWASDLARFLKAPAGVFEAVGPEYHSRINLELVGCAIQLVSPSPPSSPPTTTTASSSSSTTPPPGDDHPGRDNKPGDLGSAYILQVMSHRARLKLALDPSSTVVSPSLEASIDVSLAECPVSSSSAPSEQTSFAPIVSLNDLHILLVYSWTPGQPTCRMTLHRGSLIISFCADSADSLAEAISRLSEISFQAKSTVSHEDLKISPPTQRVEDPIVASTMLRSAMREPSSSSRSILIQKDEDLAEEDYPTNVAFLDPKRPASSHHHHHHPVNPSAPAILRSISGQGINIIPDYLLKTPSASKVSPHSAIETEVRVEHLDVLVRFYDGYDWYSTRQTIQQAQKNVRKKLQKIRQLLATGNPADPRAMEEDLGPTTLFQSIHLGLDSSTQSLSPAQLLDAIDDQLEKETAELVSDDVESMAGSWQSLTPHPSKDPQPRLVSASSSKQRHLGRSAQPMLKIVLSEVQGHFRKYHDNQQQPDQAKSRETNDRRLSSLQLRTDSLTIIDNIPTSTWKKFLTELRPGEGGMMRPTGAPMVRLKFIVIPSARDSRLKEAIIKLKISPLRLYVDQDAVDFLKTFFSFQKQSTSPPSSTTISSAPDSTGAPPDELFFQRVEILPIRIKLDYKPKRVDYMALKEGKTIELMNFFHFEGSDMVLRHATLTGISRASKIGELLQEIWTPDVKANQLADVISGIAPVRSVVNLGTGIADLVLLPIEEMKKKDGRLSRGIQKGTSSFAKNTTLEVIKLGARLAIGTQVILEKAESILGAKFNQELCVETIDHHHHQHSSIDPNQTLEQDPITGLPTNLIGTQAGENRQHELISRYALQPQNFKVGAQSAYEDLRQNLRSTAQTILAVPLEVFNEGSGQAVVKAVPIAILHPMVGATGAISKTLLGLHNSLDPQGSTSHRLDKYKQQPSPSSSSSH
ncbi:hypothetical protein PSTG_12310 [Puccinia striiformis f. sp. tritici PST-78]|uniref:Autophagy-related protein 2 n=1 Tax=Puccinia striiformis f. sp. tritici PST-78 TaxID=1165861 RepID=A0A0L0V5J1_9BASI|nr:hypothetical protein PSTG_12310 [Puccinia striiformis f. sp. tritici PST-78]